MSTSYRYVKEQPKKPMRRSLMISFFLMGLGGGVLLWAFWPIVAFRISASPVFFSVISPLSESHREISGSIKTISASDQSDSTSTSVDYTNANVWFPLKPQKKITSKVNAYTLTIPKLGIKDAFVVIGGEDLSHSLIHYGGTALPGQNGNSVIFGHSVLPHFFNPKNYKTIFSTLPTIDIEDSIYIKYDDVTYQYKVEEMTIHEPEDLSVLEQQYDDSYITLVTCVPPGTYWQRLNVRARLVKI